MPTTTGKATDFITFTRASNATVTDSDGKIKWAPHNLLTNSESFNASSWFKTSATVTANATTAPNGSTTADLVQFSAQYGHLRSTFSMTAGETYTYGIWVWVASGTRQFSVRDFNVGTEFLVINATTTPTLFTATFTAPSGAGSLMIIQDRNSSGFVNTYLWGAHLYRSDLGGMQPNTSAYPMYNPTTPKNLLGYTEAFDNAAWTKTNSSITANTVVAPNGLQTADLLTSDATSSAHQISQGLTGIANTPLSLSVYVKAGTSSYVFLRLTGTAGTDNWTTAVFDLSSTSTTASQTATGSSSGTILAYSKTNVGDGWWRLSLIGYINRTDPYYTIGFAAAATGNTFTTSGRPSNFAGTTSDTFYLWGAQLSDSASLDTYSPVYGAAVTSAAYYGPRRDFDPVTLACKGLLVEEQRTNLFQHSAAFDNAVWAKGNGVTVTADATTAPDGTSTADKVVSANATAQMYVGEQTIAVTSGVTYSQSVFAKAGEYNLVQLRFSNAAFSNAEYATFNLATGTIVQSSGSGHSIAAVGNGWYRCTAVAVATSTTNTFPAINLATSASGGRNPSITGDGTSGLFLWGAQLEAGSFATSYIPTGAATATRNADVASVSTQAFPYSGSEGTIVGVGSSFETAGVYTPMIVALTDGTTNNMMRLLLRSNRQWSGTASNVVEWDIDAGNPAPNVISKVAGTYKANDIAVSVDGGVVGTDASAIIPTVNVLQIGNAALANYTNGHIRQITYLPRRISNAELQQRTSA